MDILCRFCREPWDFECLHDEVDDRAFRGVESSYAVVAAEFRQYGCGALWGFQGLADPVAKRCGGGKIKADPIVSAMYELLGDDMDGAAAMLEDMGIY
jgi:hypothetical protein